MLVVCRLAPTLLGMWMAGLLLLSLNSHSHKKMFVTVTSSTVRPMAFSTKTNEILIYLLRSFRARRLGGRSLLHSARMRDDSCAVLAIPYSAKFSRRIIFAVFADWLRTAKITRRQILLNSRISEAMSSDSLRQTRARTPFFSPRFWSLAPLPTVD